MVPETKHSTPTYDERNYLRRTPGSNLLVLDAAAAIEAFVALTRAERIAALWPDGLTPEEFADVRGGNTEPVTT